MNSNNDDMQEYFNVYNQAHYEERIVAYIDILGWKSFTEKSITDHELMKKMSLAIFVPEMAKKIKDSEIEITQFSDCLVISSTINPKFEFFNTLKDIIQKLIQINGFMLRGAVTIGKLCHRNNMVYGPALVKAYEIESKLANNPRVIVDKDSELIAFKQNYRLLRKDDLDGELFIDFFQPCIFGSNIDYNKLLFKSAYKMVFIGLNEFKLDSKERRKYLWMAKYYNEALNEALKKNQLTDLKLLTY